MAGSIVMLSCVVMHSNGQTLPAAPALPSAGATAKGVVSVGKGQLDSLLNMAKSPLQPITGEVKLLQGRPIGFDRMDAQADYSYFHDTAGLGLGLFRNTQGFLGYNVNYAMTLGGLPFSAALREANGISTMNYTPFQNFYHFNFDHAGYVQTLRSKVLEKINPEAVLASALNRVNSIRLQYEQGLQTELTQMQREYASQYKSAISLPAGATNLSANDMGALQNQMIPGDALEKYRQDLAMVQEMARNKDPKSLASDSNYVKKMGDVKKYETMENMYNHIVSAKRRFENNTLVRELKSRLPFTPENFKAYISDPRNLEKVLDDQGGLSSLQRFFYNIKTLDLGQNAVQSGDMAMQNTMNTGVNMEYQNKTASLGMMYGKNNSVNNWQQAGLTSQVTNEFSNMAGFKIGTGTGSPLDQSISFNFFNFNGSPATAGVPGSAAYLPMASHHDGAITLHSGLQLSGQHSITVDISKSFGAFQQNVTGDSSLNKSISGGSVFNNAGKSNYAAMVSYDGELFNTDVRVFVKSVGLGYNNPGNALLRSGESQYGLGLARKFLGQRLSLRYNGDYRHQVFDPEHNYTYTAFTSKAQVGYKIDRNNRVNLTWQRSDYHSDFYGQAAVGGVNSRLQLDGAYRFFVGKKKIMNNLTISSQRMSLPLFTGGAYTNNTLLLTNTSSFLVGRDLLSLTLLNSQSDNKSYYFNTGMFNGEVNYSYAVSAGSNIRLASCLGYYTNAGWNKQLGVRQQISAQLKEKLTLDLQVSCRRAVQVIRPELADQLFFCSSVHYTFK